MSKRKGRKATASRRSDASGNGTVLGLFTGGVAALLVATPLIPTESTAELGVGIALSMGWFVLLLGWSLTCVVSPRPVVRWGTTSTAVAVFLGLCVVSGCVMAWQGQPRTVINSVWQWVTFGIVFFLVRQVMRPRVQCRAMVAVMISLAVCLSAHAFHQYFYSMPETRAIYDRDPSAALAAAGIHAPPNSPARVLFRSRLFSMEPTSTFALANSLAGFLVPWLVMLAGIAFSVTAARVLTESSSSEAQAAAAPSNAHGGQVPHSEMALIFTFAAISLVMMGGCWLLTKSRAAWLATGLGIALLALSIRRRGWRIDSKVVVAALVVLFVALALTVAVGVDWLVITDAYKSVLYRVQYWQATVGLIRDHWWFGCGPGNFQHFYSAYKLPAASETVADPHNVFLEIWATAGTPALAAFGAVLVCFVRQVSRAKEQGNDDVDDSQQPPVWPIYGGAVVGLVIATPVCQLFGFQFDLAVYLHGAPAAALTLALSHRWVLQGELSPTPAACALAALLINLLAAGGISYAGVGTSVWLLMAVALNLHPPANREFLLPHRRTWILVGVACALLLCMYSTAYRPILRSREKLTDGGLLAVQGRLLQAERAYLAAAQRDPHASQPWNLVAELRHGKWLRSGDSRDWAEFRDATKKMLARNSRSSNAYSRCGDWLLAGYRAHGDDAILTEAIRFYRRVVELYPNYNRGRAQLAWVLRLAGDHAGAEAEASRALELDQMNPHYEQKLNQFQMFDPGPPARAESQPPGPGDRHAEQWMEEIRNIRQPHPRGA